MCADVVRCRVRKLQSGQELEGAHTTPGCFSEVCEKKGVAGASVRKRVKRKVLENMRSLFFLFRGSELQFTLLAPSFEGSLEGSDIQAAPKQTIPKPVIPTGAARFFPPRRFTARRAAERRDLLSSAS